MLVVDLDSSTPLADQLVALLRRALAAGVLCPGDELPPVRQLAADLGVNLNTVARAYKTLEGVGLLRAARGRGTRVVSAEERPPAPRDEAKARIVDRLRDALADARLAGLDRRQAGALVDAALEEFYGTPTHTGPSAA